MSARENELKMSDKLVQEKLAELTGLFESANLVERVSWVGSQIDYIEVFADHAEAHWRTGDPEDVSHTRDVGVWLRR